jgi:carboxylesterase type B
MVQNWLLQLTQLLLLSSIVWVLWEIRYSVFFPNMTHLCWNLQLGFMAPDGSTNLAVKDMVSALNFLKKVVPSFGGNAAKITIAGQSSGANMVRALLAVPSASSLFQSGILQSDPMVNTFLFSMEFSGWLSALKQNYGFLSTTTQQTLQTFFNSQIPCSSSDQQCLNGLSLDSIINAEMNLFGNAVNLDASADQFEPMRPVKDGSFITSPLDSTAPFPHQTKPILITNAKDDAGFAIFGQFTDPVPPSSFKDVVLATFGSNRTELIVSSSFYAAGGAEETLDARPTIEDLGTDYLWRCSGWTFARNWVQNGGKAFVGEYTVGATYPGNEAVPFCTQDGVVCHQDDIEIVVRFSGPFLTIMPSADVQFVSSAQYRTPTPPNQHSLKRCRHDMPHSSTTAIPMLTRSLTGQPPRLLTCTRNF